MESPPYDTLVVPSLVAIVSVAILGFMFLLSVLRKMIGSKSDDQSTDLPNGAGQGRVIKHIKHLGGPTIIAFQVIRLISCLALFGLSLYTTLSTSDNGEVSRRWRVQDLPQIAVCATYVSILLIFGF